MPDPLHKAFFCKNLSGKKVHCLLCMRGCIIADGNAGLCGVRKNIGGKLHSLVYGKTLTMEIDPIEKKPLFHFRPGSHCLGISTYGCNFTCLHCFAPETRVVGSGGVMPIGSLFYAGEPLNNVGDVAARKFDDSSVVTCASSFSELAQGFEHFYEGCLLEIKPFYLPAFKCTPNHKIFVHSNGGKPLLKLASELKCGDRLVVPKKYSSKPRESIDLADFFKQHSFLFKKNAWKCGLEKAEEIFSLYSSGATSKELGKKFGLHPTYVRFLVSKIRKHGFSYLFEHRGGVEAKGGKIRFKFSKSVIPRFIKLDEGFAKLLGYYCAEGSVYSPSNKPSSYVLRFSFGKHELAYIKEIQALLSKIFAVYSSISITPTTLQLNVSNSMVALLFKSLVGHGAKNKFVPKELFHADDGAVKAFLEGYVAGDGWVGKDIISMNTVSENLAYGLCGLLLKVGVLPRFYVWNPAKTKEIGMRTIRQSTLYYVKVAISSPRKFFEEKAYRETKNLNKKCLEQENRFLIPISKIKTHAYKGPVYNLEVKSEHSYLANFVSVANCQNAGISQQRSEDAISKVPFTSPEEIVEQAVAAGVEGIAYTYTEPTIFAEYALDTMRLARKKGLYNAWVSNGYMSKECIDAIAPFLDAINIDLKGNAEFYKEVCGNANIDFIKENISYLHKKKVHLEVTCLLVPDYNDNEKGFREISEFIASIDKKMPLHFTAFWPQYKMRHLPPTDLQKLQKAKEIALKAGLEFVFIGNTGEEESTNCPKCGDLLVRRIGFAAEAIGLDKNGKCKKCGEKTGIIV